jgi:hypothetical protein
MAKVSLILPAVTLKAKGTATLAAPAINKMDVNASHWRDGRSHSDYDARKKGREKEDFEIIKN